MEPLGTPEITVETVWRTILVTDARDSSKAYFSERSEEALIRIERDRALFARIAAAHGGEEARDRGDGSMFAFNDPSAALRAAMLMQSEMARLNAALPAHALRLVHRMGIQMGSVKLATTVGEPTRRKLSGDIVVMAARLESICHPGEVCFTKDVYQAVRGTIDHEFRSFDATLKGLDGPVRVWSTRLDRDWARPFTAAEEQSQARRREETRLREKWEREQRDQRRRRVATVAASWAALFSVTCAALSAAYTQLSFNPIARMKEALRDPAPAATARHATLVPKPPTTAQQRRLAWAAVPKTPQVSSAKTPRSTEIHLVSRRQVAALRLRTPRARVTALLRQTLNAGRFEELPGRLRDLGLSMAEFQSLCDDARRVEMARDWLQERIEPTMADDPPGIRMEHPVAGIARLMRAEDGMIHGLDENERPLSITFLDLPPDALGDLVRAVASSDETPDAPDAVVRSLAALRRRAGR